MPDGVGVGIETPVIPREMDALSPMASILGSVEVAQVPLVIVDVVSKETKEKSSAHSEDRSNRLSVPQQRQKGWLLPFKSKLKEIVNAPLLLFIGKVCWKTHRAKRTTVTFALKLTYIAHHSVYNVTSTWN